jgi:hypothetical protein
VIPKAHSIFLVNLDLSTLQSVTIFGNHFSYDPAERSSKRFKSKETIAL